MLSYTYSDNSNIKNKLNTLNVFDITNKDSNKKDKVVRNDYNNRLVSRSRKQFPEKFLNKAFKVMNGIKLQESGGSYTSESSWSSASGAYGYIDSTWNNYGGYARAKDAPKMVQDQRMFESLFTRWKEKDGDWSKVIAAHFYPAWSDDKSLWYQVPSPGNPSIWEYVREVKDKANI